MIAEKRQTERAESTYPEASWLVSLMVVQKSTTTEEVLATDTGDSTA
jgi:hypothetical protein